VLLPYRAGAETSLPAVRLLESHNCRAIELRSAHARHVILCRTAKDSGLMEAAGLNSGGKLLAVGFTSDSQHYGSIEVH